MIVIRSFDVNKPGEEVYIHSLDIVCLCAFYLRAYVGLNAGSLSEIILSAEMINVCDSGKRS